MRNKKLIPDSNPNTLKKILKQDFKGRTVAFWADHSDSTKYRITNDGDESVIFYLLPGISLCAGNKCRIHF